MDVEKIAVFASLGFAIAVAAFVLWGPSPKPRKKGKVIGINNLGYTCFLNSLLQALAACPIFIEWLKQQSEKNGKVNFISTLLSVFKKINGYAEDLYGDVTPIEIISSLGNLWSFAPGYQDAHELFHIVLNALQAEIQPVNRKGCLSDALPESPTMLADAEKLGDPLTFRSVSCNDIASANKKSNMPNGFDRNCNNHVMSSTSSISSISLAYSKPGQILARSSELLSKNIGNEENKESFRTWSSLCAMPVPNFPPMSIEVHPFSGLLTSQLQCSNCKWKSPVRYDKLETVSLPLPPLGPHIRTHHTLEELLTRFVTSEIVQDVLCDGCGMRCLAAKTLTLGKLPKCLCLHISRTTWSPTGTPIKRDDPVKFPQILTLDPYTFTETKKRNARGDPEATMLLATRTTLLDKYKYQLRAVVEHRGPVDSGHFVCYRHGNKPNQWLYTSDNVVENISFIEVLCATPYLLFYERINST
ncbi:ubiquitin specific protease 30 [Nomia melanderi]|uniref:ubiquitin specific protease 30 n=1 Tax=Nomia melanderi TaxID=2448451 RepID=UPI001303F98C|nr:ubiquitin carboxyl-terminal hydrolase 30 [Nomia melanderi]XP_031846048.1 ubiquitin carboxyl-terminal hydrolase 30 [Nomia melanderi]XP_031846058.1 ubiquitin carboxyl-terminal hydrolase 30 [Nomia melanderi]XP_031846067.1 ubiquitin carboxyl-terminal hydrolase 30 [Nomia melanderi]